MHGCIRAAAYALDPKAMENDADPIPDVSSMTSLAMNANRNKTAPIVPHQTNAGKHASSPAGACQRVQVDTCRWALVGGRRWTFAGRCLPAGAGGCLPAGAAMRREGEHASVVRCKRGATKRSVGPLRFQQPNLGPLAQSDVAPKLSKAASFADFGCVLTQNETNCAFWLKRHGYGRFWH